MSYNQSEFQPVLPNITDDTMKGIDNDVENVRQQNEQNNGVPSGTPVESVGVNPSAGSSKSYGKKIITVVLIVIIIILVILLIYQIYKYYTTNDSPSMCKATKPPEKTYKPPEIQPKKNVEEPYKRPPPAAADIKNKIPDHVRNLDNSVLYQYIKKDENNTSYKNSLELKERKDPKSVAYNSMIEDTKVRFDKSASDVNRIEEVEDDEFPDDSNIPSHEEMVKDIHNDMVNDNKYKASLQSIEKENSNNIINDFLSEDVDDDDSGSIKSENGGCSFALTKGKNRGQICGRKRVNATMCMRHKNK